MTRHVVAWWRRGFRALLRDAKRHPGVVIVIGAVWALASVRLFVHPTPLLPILFNWTPSLPYHVVYVDYGSRSLDRGDLVVYAFAGEAARQDYPGLEGQPFLKRVAGLPGDSISVREREVFINGVSVGWAKPVTFDRRPLEPIDATVIPPGKLYVQGTSPDSFDSRYRSSGLVDTGAIVAKVRPIL